MKDKLTELVRETEDLTLYENKYHKFIFSLKELMNFYDKILPPLGINEVYFISLSARNKYLTDEEKKELGLGRTEMFARKIVREQNLEKFIKKIREYEKNAAAYLTKYGYPIPSKCITIYLNINPSNVLKAYNEFSKTMAEYYMELGMRASSKKNIDEVSKRINKIDVLLMNCIQKNQGIKHYIDIDFDIPKESFYLVKAFVNMLKEKGVEYFVIDTKSGYHVLLKRNTITYNFNEDIEKIIHKGFQDGLQDFEIINNKNLMIPLPGTLQGGHPVRVMKEV